MARQSLGQHFLTRGAILTRIARAACGEHADLVVEIGPGRGALTAHLLELAERVVAIELDPRLASHLKDKFQDRFELVEGNALEVDLTAWGAGVLTGNLPYYAATKMITRYLRHPGELRHAVFLIQKEVAERITAKPGTRDYGYLSVVCQLLSSAEYLFRVPPGAFQPPPKVDSAVIRLTPRVPPVEDVPGFIAFASRCFRQKRKMLRNNLAGHYELTGQPDLSRRAEQIPFAELIELYRMVSKPKAPTKSEEAAEPALPTALPEESPSS